MDKRIPTFSYKTEIIIIISLNWQEMFLYYFFKLVPEEFLLVFVTELKLWDMILSTDVR